MRIDQHVFLGQKVEENAKDFEIGFLDGYYC